MRAAGGHTRPATRWLVALGAVGLAALAKLSGLLLGALALTALGLAGWRLRSRRLWLGGSALVVVVAVAVAGWWYWRNWTLVDPLLAGMVKVLPARAEPRCGVTAGAGARDLAFHVGSIWLVQRDRGCVGVLALQRAGRAGMCGLADRSAEPALPAGDGLRWTAAGLLAGWSLVVALALLRWAQINYPQGRLLFPAIAAAMALLAVGLLGLAARVAAGYYWQSLQWAMAVLAAAAPFVWIAPAMFRRPLAAEITPVNPGQGAVGEHAALVGYLYAAEQFVPGGQFDITLYARRRAPGE